MTEVEITRKQIIVVGDVGQNSYGDLTFTDKDGKEYKVGVKRKPYFDKVILPGVAVQLNYAMSSFGKEYIYNADKIEDVLPDKPPAVAAKTIVQTPLTKDEQIERAVWIKELGECIRSGDIDKTTPVGKTIRNAYYTEMCRVLGINIKAEAKRMGAKEIREE